MSVVPKELKPETGHSWRHWFTIDATIFIYCVIALSIVSSLGAIAIHVPGQISMDTSIQLYEAATGELASFNPPFMSALLRWLGGGAQSTSIIVIINAVLLYGSMATVIIVLTNLKRTDGTLRIQAWQVIASVCLIINPILFIYTGIIWKDVLFGSFLAGACAAGLAATGGGLRFKLSCTVFCLFFLSMAYLTRQQGIFMVPVLLIIPTIALWNQFPKNRVITVLSLAITFGLITVSLQSLVKLSIHSPTQNFESVGYNSIMKFDLAGIVNYSERTSSEFAFPISDDQRNAIRSVYSPSRVDFLDRNPVSSAWLTLTSDTLKTAWKAMLLQNPEAYIHHRLQSYATLLGLKGIEGTLPVHIGVDGNPQYLKAVSLEIGVNQRSHLLYSIASTFFDWPIYRHAFWLGLMVLVSAAGCKARYVGHAKSIGALIFVAAGLMYASFLPTTIASDFRYLFGAIPLVSIICLIVVFGRVKSTEQGSNQ
ncbi:MULTISPECIES: hypothetical protein [unclassified Pseudomonas]|uniref:hypothetical protein n=1 Tax=unclassified Pseudomonas TaxID=196821 RepID=UPI000A1E5C37|nr:MULTISPECIES: hypothetical protein [unclassified Pseudomonas]